MSAPDWIFWAVASPLALAGLAMLYLGLFHDRARGRRRCPKCWYDMAGANGLRCPECGREARNERKLVRIRRYWFRTATGLFLLFAAYGSFAVRAAVRGGWRTAVPGLVVAFLAPADGSGWTWLSIGDGERLGRPTDAWATEGMRRLNERTMSGLASQTFLDRFYAAFPDQRQWLIYARDRWPSGLDFTTRSRLSWPISDGTGLVLKLRFDVPGRAWVTTSFDSYKKKVSLGVPPEGPAHIQAQILDARGREVWTGTVHTLQVGGSASDIMSPLAPEGSTPLKIANASVLSLEPKLGLAGGGTVGLLLIQQGWHLAPDESDWALGSRCRVLHGEQVVATGEVLYGMVEPEMIADFFNLYAFFPLRWAAPAPSKEELADGTWRVEFVGDPAVAIADLRRDIYWNGSVTVPLSEFVPPDDWDFEWMRSNRDSDDE